MRAFIPATRTSLKSTMSKLKVSTCNGKRYPRPDYNDEEMYLSEGVARLGGTEGEYVGYRCAVIHTNPFGPHAPEGYMEVRLPCRYESGYTSGYKYWTRHYLRKKDVFAKCVELGLMSKDQELHPDPFPADCAVPDSE